MSGPYRQFGIEGAWHFYMGLLFVLYLFGLFFPLCFSYSGGKFIYFNKLAKGQELLAQIQTLLYHQQGKLPSADLALPQYKFYTEVLFALLDYSRHWGGGMLDSLRQLQWGVRQELKADRQLRSSFISGFLQFATTAAITWFFSLATGHWTGISLKIEWCVLIAFLQSMGILLYIFYYSWAQKFYLKEYWSFLAIVYQLRSGCNAGLSARRVIELVGEERAISFKQGPLKMLHVRLQTLLYQYTQLGQGISEELGLLIEDLWHQYGEARIKLNQRSSGIKFLLLACFFLSAHLIYFLSLAGSFLIEEV